MSSQVRWPAARWRLAAQWRGGVATRAVALRLLWLLLVATPAVYAQQNPLFQARVLYNQGDYDGAINTAGEGPATQADGLALIVARAYLEKFRQTADQADLVSARDALNRIRAEALLPRERQELVVGLGEALYFEEHYGAAAELFETALAASGDASGLDARERVLDWWATSLDRAAQRAATVEGEAIYARLLTRTDQEMRERSSLVAGYWFVVALRGLGELDRAWEAAVAGWVRAPLAGERGKALRADLDQLVEQALIPGRAARQAASARDAQVAALAAEWAAVKEKWK